MLTRAIQTHSIDNWRVFRNKKALVNKEIKRAKSKYLKVKLNEKNNNWKFLKKYHNQEKCTPPNSLLIEGENITSPR